MGSSRALKAFNWRSWACKAGRNGAGSTCRTSRSREQLVAPLSLPPADRRLGPSTTGEPIVFPAKGAVKSFNRIAYAAAHVVADPLAAIDPWVDTAIDWEKTVHFRHYLWDLGLGVAEAMDTAQRGGGLDWPAARELIRHTLEAAKGRPGVKVCCGVGTDHLDPAPGICADDIVHGFP